jgi:glutamate synthase (NADPH/NADH) large chain
VAFIDCTFPADADDDALRQGLERIRAEAEDAVRSGAGHLVLTDQHQGESPVACR